MIKGVIFDFDRVIIDTESRKFKDLKKILRTYGYDLKSKLFPEMVGKKTSFFLSSEYPDMPARILKDIVAKRRKMQNRSIDSYKLIPGIKELLKFLKYRNYAVAIATGSEKDFIKKILKYHSIGSYFDVIVSGEAFKSSKPNPECYKITLRKLKLMPSKVIVVEDSIAGIRAGKTAGCRVFAITTYYNKQDLSSADNIFKNHTGIYRYLESHKV